MLIVRGEYFVLGEAAPPPLGVTTSKTVWIKSQSVDFRAVSC